MKKEINNNYTQFVDCDNIVSFTQQGVAKEFNEDYILNLKSDFGIFTAVIDGTGASNGFNCASKICHDSLTSEFYNHSNREATYALKQAFFEANRYVMLKKYNNTNESIGACATGIYIQKRKLVIANIGNCRAYLFRDGKLTQLTKDHTIMQDLVDIKNLDIEKAKNHPEANSLTKIIGATTQLDLDLNEYYIWDKEKCDIKCNDYIFMCSDGVHKYITDEKLESLIDTNNLQSSIEHIVEYIKNEDAIDDMSLIIIPLKGQLKSVPPTNYTNDDKKLEFEDDKETEESVKEEEKPALGIFFYIFELLTLIVLMNIISFLTIINKLV